jgi:Kef-type K+ transport system membrane component KefB
VDELFYLSLILVLGSFMKWVSYKIKILNVVGYLILGFLIGPNMLNIIPKSFVENSHIIIDISLSLISVFVGANLKYNILKGVWKQIVLISILEALFTFILIGIAFYSFFSFLDLGCDINYRLTIALIFGALASATAPATILAVIHELKPKGNFASFLLGVVASDNALTLILFSFVVLITKGNAEVNWGVQEGVFSIFPTLFFTILLGFFGAFVSEMIDRIFKNYQNIKTTSTLGMIFLIYSLADKLNLDPLLASLVMGMVMSNLSKEFFVVKSEFDHHLKDIIFVLFFTLSAMHLNINFLLAMPFVIVLYVVFRISGKILGVWVGGWLSNSQKSIQKYLGIALFPQAGIAIGLALSLQNEDGFEIIAPIVLNVIIATTMIHEMVGPLLTKFVLQKTQNLED